MAEREVVSRIRAYLLGSHAKRVWILKTHGSAMQAKGVPDLLVCLGGRFLAIETKRASGMAASAIQERTIHEIREAGGIAGVAASVADAQVLEREAMCAIKPLYQFEVTEARLERAVQAIQAARSKLTQQQAMEVFFELGFGDAIEFDPQGKLQLELTDLQLIAAAAGLHAAAEAGGKQVVQQGMQ